MTTRRDALLALPLLGAAASVRVQVLRTGSPKRLGFLAIYEEPKVPRAGRPIYVAMRKKGWVLGENLRVEPAYADWKAERLARLTEQLVRSRVDIIFAAIRTAGRAAT